jgi:hypothetical protein
MVRQTAPLEAAILKEREEGKVLTAKGTSQYRSLLGMFAYLQHTRPDLLFAISFFGQWGNNPTPEALKRLQHACSYAASTASLGLVFALGKYKEMQGDFSRIVPSEESTKNGWMPGPRRPWHFDVFTDATYQAGRETSLAGYAVLLNHQMIAMRAAKQRRRAHSSTRAELLTCYDTTDVSLAMRLLLMELQVQPSDISITVWCDADNVVKNVHSRNPHCTEETSTAVAVELHRIFIKHHTQDDLRLAFPRAADIIEGMGTLDDNLILNLGEGARGRFQPVNWRSAIATTPYLETPEDAQCISIATRMADGGMYLVHISGVNQLADGMTKMDTSIDHVGRLVHARKDFELGRPTPIRDGNGKIHYQRAPRADAQEPDGVVVATMPLVLDTDAVIRLQLAGACLDEADGLITLGMEVRKGLTNHMERRHPNWRELFGQQSHPFTYQRVAVETPEPRPLTDETLTQPPYRSDQLTTESSLGCEPPNPA